MNLNRYSLGASLLIISVILAGICLAQIPLNRQLDGYRVEDSNVRMLLEMRTSRPQDRTNAGILGLTRWFPNSTDQPEGHLLWRWMGIDDTECIASITDVNGDGYPDVLTENFDSGASGNNFSCLSGHPEDSVRVIWSVLPLGGPSNSGGNGDQCVNTISDLNNDGHQDALLGTAWGGRTVFAINGLTGATLWSYDTYNDPVGSGWIYSIAPIPDVNNDGIEDVLAGAGSTCRSAFCFSGATGAMLWRHQALDAVGSVHAISDVNGDGVADALVAAWGNSLDRKVYCISGASSGTGTVIWNHNCGGDIQHVTSIPDVNASGYDDVIASTWSSHVYCLEGSTGSQIWDYPFGAYASRAEVVPDVNGDGFCDVFAGGWSSAVRMLNGTDGHVIWTRTLNGGNTWTVYPIGDVDGDGIGDVVAGNSVSGGTGGMVYCLSGVDGEIIWDYLTNGWVNTVRNIGDINGDFMEDVIAGNQGGPGPFVWCFEGDTLAGGALILKVSEFMVTTTATPTVEIYNPNSSEVNLAGWRIIQRSPTGETTCTIDNGVSIPAEGYRDVNATNTQGMALPEEGGILILTTPTGELIDSVGYGSMGGAPAPPLDWSTARDFTSTFGWAESYTLDVSSTWEAPNDPPPQELGTGGIFINEVYPTGGAGSAFIELYNVSFQTIDISGWQIIATQVFTIPSGVGIDSGGYFVLFEEAFPQNFGCGPEGDNIYLMNDEGVRVDQMGWWGGWAGDSSWSAIPDGNRTTTVGFNLVTCPDFHRAFPSPGGHTAVPRPGHNDHILTAQLLNLGPAYPNPFNATTQISYSLDRAGEVKLIIYDILGREVATLFHGNGNPGLHSIIWQPDNLASGIYYAFLKTSTDTRTIRITLLK